MSVGKYSPTVSFSYGKDQDWFKKNGGGFGNGNNPHSDLDNDGYDSYGYNENEVDRAGNSEMDYLASVDYENFNDPYYYLFENTQSDWINKSII